MTFPRSFGAGGVGVTPADLRRQRLQQATRTKSTQGAAGFSGAGGRRNIRPGDLRQLAAGPAAIPAAGIAKGGGVAELEDPSTRPIERETVPLDDDTYQTRSPVDEFLDSLTPEERARVTTGGTTAGGQPDDVTAGGRPPEVPGEIPGSGGERQALTIEDVLALINQSTAQAGGSRFDPLFEELLGEIRSSDFSALAGVSPEEQTARRVRAEADTRAAVSPQLAALSARTGGLESPAAQAAAANLAGGALSATSRGLAEQEQGERFAAAGLEQGRQNQLVNLLGLASGQDIAEQGRQTQLFGDVLDFVLGGQQIEAQVDIAEQQIELNRFLGIEGFAVTERGQDLQAEIARLDTELRAEIAERGDATTRRAQDLQRDLTEAQLEFQRESLRENASLQREALDIQRGQAENAFTLALRQIGLDEDQLALAREQGLQQLQLSRDQMAQAFQLTRDQLEADLEISGNQFAAAVVGSLEPSQVAALLGDSGTFPDIAEVLNTFARSV